MLEELRTLTENERCPRCNAPHPRIIVYGFVIPDGGDNDHVLHGGCSRIVRPWAEVEPDRACRNCDTWWLHRVGEPIVDICEAWSRTLFSVRK